MPPEVVVDILGRRVACVIRVEVVRHLVCLMPGEPVELERAGAVV
jgi:hypothetical protein